MTTVVMSNNYLQHNSFLDRRKKNARFVDEQSTLKLTLPTVYISSQAKRELKLYDYVTLIYII